MQPECNEQEPIQATAESTTQFKDAELEIHSDHTQNGIALISSYSDDNISKNDKSVNTDENIITITTASINDYAKNPKLYTELTQIKTHKTHTTASKIINFFSKKETQQPIENSTSSNNNNHLANIRSPNSLAGPWKFSHCISFQENIADVHHRKGRRINGLQTPLHPLQLFGWFVLILFGLAAYWILIPTFNTDIQGPLYGLITGLYIVHIVSHLVALLIDPADRELRRVHRNDRIVPEFDRSKHAHVIENGRCHLCNIRTSSHRTKHCSVCNKCVGKFDHHCKWLNHCIGSRNYVAFLMCVVSAVCATLVILLAVIAQIVLYYLQPEWLSYWYPSPRLFEDHSVDGSQYFILNGTSNETNTSPNYTDTDYEEILFTENSTLPTLMENVTLLIKDSLNDSLAINTSSTINSLNDDDITKNITKDSSYISHNSSSVSFAGIAVSHTIFLILLGCLGLLAAITAGLLLHLCFFHIYISFLGLTTYEYIRNHRQAQEAKNKLAATAKNSQIDSQLNPPTNNHPSKRTSECGQFYMCSKRRHPNDADLTLGQQNSYQLESNPHINFHCCANSREYHQTALKTYYMCSLLEESNIKTPLTIAHISGANTDLDSTSEDNADAFNTFHCCTSFKAASTQRRLSGATTKAMLVKNLETATATLNNRRSFLQYTEQCTFCSFRLRSPIFAKRESKSKTNKTSTQKSDPQQMSRTSSGKSHSSVQTSAAQKRCCMQTISKHQRWRRKWNCCSAVPDSPDVPNDIIAALANKHHQELAVKMAHKEELSMNYVNPNGNSAHQIPHNSSSTEDSLKVTQANLHNNRTWPVSRFRHFMRVINRYRRPRCRLQHNTDQSLKQNQVRPIYLQKEDSCCKHKHSYASSSSATTISPNNSLTESSREPSSYSDNSSGMTTPSSQGTATFKTSVLPTSIIRDDTSVTYTTPIGITVPPALPPPTRRRIPSTADLEELAETLAFVSSQPTNITNSPYNPMPRLPTVNNIYRRQRRKHFLRTRSPTLSPIHESGLSNPTSPQPCRHNVTSCTPATNLANNLCASTLNTSEIEHKTSSNNSLHSDTSTTSSSSIN
ncbi:uncharacterized protein LOC111689320 [Lucilia cuprina]|uniref:uncharacterized protein LOC111689320 n=1 Tax=Lucilia cuprina TaxID=7375 RepID=UPI001F057C07|nr:uncharacterized protein LOC111689320 [Lucilia cuprina]XP_046812287.1 uncharacterized protein LOC111689320 [Lucilia cuprina]XP_046812288.1 uncharacterized protein LOC111689320 [Lucilia cuprina]XP_046812289.1 uncharacterized protein LOC111689320 [Lucilia cuprina]